VLSVGERKVMCAYKENYPGASQKNRLLPTTSSLYEVYASVGFVFEMSKKKVVSIYRRPNLTPILGLDKVWRPNGV
jgi:hypothetical protein